MRSGFLGVAIAAMIFAPQAFASGITYTCDASIDATMAGTCAYLNSFVSGIYNSTFTNANASIYIEMTNVGLGGSTTGYFNSTTFSTYLSRLSATDSGDTVDTGALAALRSSADTLAFGGGSVVLTSANAEALGLSGLTGMTASGNSCTIGTAGCYNGTIYVVTPAGLAAETSNLQTMYYDQNGGSQPSNAYDFYSVVQHETDEILGTSSCMHTDFNTMLWKDVCDFLKVGTPSAADLFRYNAAGSLALDSAYEGLANAQYGAYFSYNGGVTDGFGNGAFYNTAANNGDYGDTLGYCSMVQNAYGCPGAAPRLGQGEINLLDAIGYNVVAPEPGTMWLIAAGLMALFGRGVTARSPKTR